MKISETIKILENIGIYFLYV